MHNFIIKPATLTPSTYSQIGRVLIPSKDCDNRKIARKFTEKGATFKTDVFGSTTISAPFISTFKRFDRPSPIISTHCQPCKTISVPTVTDKTIYPCSLGKYDVTEYSNTSNTIGPLGNSMFPRITTSDYQLYQQYRVTDKNNIQQLDICDCPYTLETGVYIFSDPSTNDLLPVFLFTDGCEIICYNTIDPGDQKPSTPVKIGECKYRIDIGEEQDILEVIGNNTIKIFNENNPSVSLTTTLNLTEGNDNINGNDTILNLIDFVSEQLCPKEIVITNLKITNGVLTFEENGVKVNLGKYYEKIDNSGDIKRFYSNETSIYEYNQNDEKIVLKLTCDCYYRRPT